MYFPSISTTKECKPAAVYHSCCNLKVNNYVHMPFFVFLNLTHLPDSEGGRSNYWQKELSFKHFYKELLEQQWYSLHYILPAKLSYGRLSFSWRGFQWERLCFTDWCQCLLLWSEPCSNIISINMLIKKELHLLTKNHISAEVNSIVWFCFSLKEYC